MGLFDMLKKLKPKTAWEIERERQMKLGWEHMQRVEEQLRKTEEGAKKVFQKHEEVEETRKTTDYNKYFGKTDGVKDPEAAAAAGLPAPMSDGCLYKNRFENSGAKIQKAPASDLSIYCPQMPYPEQRSFGLLTEEVPSTISIDSIVEMPRNRRHTEELRRKDAELAALSEFLDKQELLPPDPLSLFRENKYEKHPLYKVIEKINDRSLSEEDRLSAIMGVIEKDIIKIMGDNGSEYDRNNKKNISHIREISLLLLRDMDKKGVCFDLDDFKTDGFMSPEFMLYRKAVSAAAKQGIDMGLRVNPLYEKMKSLEEKGSSSGIFSRISFRDLVIAAGARLNWRMGSFLRPYSDDPGAIQVAKASAHLMFAEKTTPGWILADTLAMAYEIYDLSGKWVDGLPYFMMSGLPEYMKSKYPGYPEEFPLVAGREDALAAAYREAGSIRCYDCDKLIQPDSIVYAIRRTYGGATGAESYYCPECAEKFLEEMKSYEKEGRIRIISTVTGGLEHEEEKFI